MGGRIRASASGLASLVALACTGRASFIADDAEDAGATSGAGTAGTFADDGAPPAPVGSVSTSDGGSTGTGTSDAPDGVTFIVQPDCGNCGWECDIFMQDCPPGEKCMPYADDGGAAWNATACFPIARDPVGYGDTCEVEGNGVSGIDDCDAGLMCWNVNRDDFGHCAHFCTGSADNPTCPLPDQYCPISSEGVALICMSPCDPLAQDCSTEGYVCYPTNDTWGCAPDASGAAGTFGDPCEYINGCDPLHVCVGADALTACENTIGCCAPLCDVFDAAADAACAALDPGMSCEPWYPADHAPPAYEHIGVCMLPL